jgi:magnesium-transporting ATPase (P-type)
MFKPSSKPYGWPNSTTENISKKPSRIIYFNDEQKYWFCSNVIVTHKYEWYSFLPLFLLEEFNPFTKLAHIYFLFISILQTVPMITNTGGVPTVLIPLVQLLIIAASFKITDDVERHRADNEANSTTTLIYDNKNKNNNNDNNFKKNTWADIQVGQFIKVQSTETIPADIILLSVSSSSSSSDEQQSTCFIETKSLDGETNLKTRSVHPDFLTKVGKCTTSSHQHFYIFFNIITIIIIIIIIIIIFIHLC